MTKKKILSALLAGVMALSSTVTLASCSGKTKEPPKQKREHVYSAVEKPLDGGITYINQMMACGSDVYFLYNKEYTVTYNELGEEVERTDGYDYRKIETQQTSLPEGWWYGYGSAQCLGKYNVDSGSLTQVPLKVGESENAYMNNVCLTPDGALMAMMQEWVYNEDYTESTVTYTLYELNAETGETISKSVLNDSMVKGGLDPANIYLNQMVVGRDGQLYFTCDNGILIFDRDGTFRMQVEGIDGWVNTMSDMGDGMLVSWYPNTGSGGQQYKVLKNGKLEDFASAALTEAMKNRYYNFMGSVGGKLYLSDDSGVWTYDPSADVLAEEMNYINSDVDNSNSGSLVVLEDGRIVMASTEWTQEETKTTLNIMTKVPDEELSEEIIVTLGCIYTDYYLKKSLIRYNKQNTGVRIAVKDYSIYNNEENEWEGAKTQLNNDIITGSLPDIVLLDSTLPVESYFHKGIFADLTPYIDGENGIDRSKYLSNIFDLCTVNGKQYSMILSFSINSLLAKSEFVGKEPGWTFEEMMNCIGSMPEGMEAFWGESRDSIIDTFFRYSMESFVDWDTGETKFETPGFIEFIKYLSTCSEKTFWDEYYGDGKEYDEEAYREADELYAMRYWQNRGLFNFGYFSMFTDLLYNLNTFATKDVTAIGYPTDTEGANGACIVPGIELAISQKSPARDQAWEILRFFMTDEQLEKDNYQFIPRIAALEAKAETESKDYIGAVVVDEVDADVVEEAPEDGALDIGVEPEDEYAWYLDYGYSQEYVDYMKNSRQKFDQSMVDQTMELIRGAGSIVRSDDALLEIIKEELSGFFAGTKSAEETARVIGSRVMIYVSENS